MNSIDVRLPDGKLLSVEVGSTVLDVAAGIGPGLAKAALAGQIDGELVDLRLPLERDCALEIVTAKHPLGGEVLATLQHDGDNKSFRLLVTVI